MTNDGEERVFGVFDVGHAARMGGDDYDKHSYQPRPSGPSEGGGGANTQPRPAPTPPSAPPPQKK